MFDQDPDRNVGFLLHDVSRLLRKRFDRRARALGLDVIHEGNAESFAYAQSVVIDRTGDMQRSAEVARLLGIRHYVQQVSDDPYLLEGATIIVGKDYKRLDLLAP